MVIKNSFTEDELVLLYNLKKNKFEIDEENNKQVIKMLMPKSLPAQLANKNTHELIKINVRPRCIYYTAEENTLNMNLQLSGSSYARGHFAYAVVYGAGDKPKPKWFKATDEHLYLVLASQEYQIGLQNCSIEAQDTKQASESCGNIYLTNLNESEKHAFIEAFQTINPRDLGEFLSLQSARFKYMNEPINPSSSIKAKLNHLTKETALILDSHNFEGAVQGQLYGFAYQGNFNYMFRERIITNLETELILPYLDSVTDLLSNLEDTHG